LPLNGSLFAELDRFCGQFALALHNAELQIYAVLTLLLVLGILLFPPRNDPDQAERGRNRSDCGEFTARQLTMRSAHMLSLVITLLIIAIIAGILGFGGIAGAAVGIAKIIFFIALVLFVISLLTHGMRGGFGRRL
jgi:uncharacterized membrane protein YtjA (UPF0391 family)